jgi:hypothetical protein
MSVDNSTDLCNLISDQSTDLRTPEQIAERLNLLAHGFQGFVTKAVKDGLSFDQAERETWMMVLRAGFEAMELFVSLQGDGDVGDQVTTDEQRTLCRSDEPAQTEIRSIFGRHRFEQYTYSPGKKRRIELRPISARMQLPENQWSFLLQEFSQMFCVEQAFQQAANNLTAVFKASFSADTLEQTNQRMGAEADVFLDQLPIPAAEDEGELLVASADCKGVPLVKQDAAKVAAFETAKKRPGNRRMATVTSVYSVDRHVRTAEQITEALFRDEEQKPLSDLRKSGRRKKKRPRPKHKHTTAHFPSIEQDGDSEIRISGIHEGMAWLGEQVESRRRKRQILVLLMDGQESLWDVASMHLGSDTRLVEVLDIIHVATYVWEAASLFHKNADARKAFTRERLTKLLGGEVAGVIRGLRRMGSLRKLSGDKLKDLRRICGYFEKHKERMRYDEYLRKGYPIASGVIEGACRHLVKDRMERSGMRWTLENARSMLGVRAVFQSDYWERFHRERIAKQTLAVHPHRNLIHDYTPLTLAC